MASKLAEKKTPECDALLQIDENSRACRVRWYQRLSRVGELYFYGESLRTARGATRANDRYGPGRVRLSSTGALALALQ